jgi:hypothetical protein
MWPIGEIMARDAFVTFDNFIVKPNLLLSQITDQRPVLLIRITLISTIFIRSTNTFFVQK